MVKPRGRVRDKAVTARRRNAKPESAPDSGDAVASLQSQLDQRTRELREAQEQQAATSEVLKVISSSPGELEPVFQAMLENAVRLCEGKFATLYLYQGNNAFRTVATYNAPPSYVEARTRDLVSPPPDLALGLIAATKRVVHIADIKSIRSYIEGHPVIVAAVDLAGFRTVLAVPMLKDDELIGSIHINRQEIHPFSDKQIELMQNFAAQAVIAIENARLLNELRQRTDDLTESLEQQTATSEVLKVISSSPGELEPVFSAMLESATRICEAHFGNLMLFQDGVFRVHAMCGAAPTWVELRQREPVVEASPLHPFTRVIKTKQLQHIADMRGEEGYLAGERSLVQFVETAGARTNLIVPMLKENDLIGAIAIYRQEVRPFTEEQIGLVQNFAAQAVIAIENARLLNELRQRTDDLSESLEQQTAASEVLRVISSSAGELEPVFSAMLENATRLCEARFGTLGLREGDAFRVVALHNAPPKYMELRKREPLIRPTAGSGLGRILATKQVVHIPDLRADQAYIDRVPSTTALVETADARSLLVAPMLKDDDLVGVIAIYQPGSPAVHRQADRVGEELRCASGDRNREHAAAQRAARIRFSDRPRPRRFSRSFRVRRAS